MQADKGTPALPPAFNIGAARKYLRTVGKVCVQIADSPDDLEVRAAFRTLEQIPHLLRRHGLSQQPAGEQG